MFCDIFLYSKEPSGSECLCYYGFGQRGFGPVARSCDDRYPMGLPPHDPIRMEFENQEDLTGTQVTEIFSAFLKEYSTQN